MNVEARTIAVVIVQFSVVRQTEALKLRSPYRSLVQMDLPPERNLVGRQVWATDEEYAGWAYYLNEEASYPWGLKRVSLGVLRD